MKLHGFLKSSMNPEQVSNSVRGFVLMVSGTLIILAKLTGLEITQAEIVEFAGVLGASAGSLWFLYGLIMKVIMKFNKK